MLTAVVAAAFARGAAGLWNQIRRLSAPSVAFGEPYSPARKHLAEFSRAYFVSGIGADNARLALQFNAQYTLTPTVLVPASFPIGDDVLEGLESGAAILCHVRDEGFAAAEERIIQYARRREFQLVRRTLGPQVVLFSRVRR